MSKLLRFIFRLNLISAVLLSLVFLGGCTVRLIMDYDPVLDQGITTAQSGTEQFLSKLDSEVGTPEAAYSKNTDFYVTMDAQLRTLQTRAQSEPKSKIVVQQVTELQNSFSDLQKLHQLDGDKGMGHLEINAARSGLENQFVSLLTLQLALKNRLKTPMTTATAPATN